MIGSDPYNQQRFQNWLSQIDRLRTMTMAEQPSVFESPDDAAPNHFGAALDAATKARTTRAVADDVEPSVLVGDPGQPYNSPNVPGREPPLPGVFNGSPDVPPPSGFFQHCAVAITHDPGYRVSSHPLPQMARGPARP
jgi:hypothetical protein